MDKSKFVESFAKDLFEKLEIPVDIDVHEDKESIHVAIEGENLGVIIGRYGETLNSLEQIIGIALLQKFETPMFIKVDAGGWRKSREESLQEMALRAITKVEETGREYEFPPMSPAERRLVHMVIGEHDTVTSESIGEGNDRRIVLKAK